MNISKIASIALVTTLALPVSAQTSDAPSKLPSVALGAGVLYFNGDIGKGAGVTPYSTVRSGFCLTLEEKPLPYLGISLGAVYGKLSASERSLDTNRNLNFESKIIQGDLLINLHLAGLVLKPDADVDPFFYAGVSFLSFSPYADLKDANGNPYYYWSDGSIRNEPQNASDIITAKIVHRDYTYETKLDSGKYSDHTFSIPVGGGIKLRITDNFSVKLQTTYYFTFSPNIDNYKISGKNNRYIFSFVDIAYQFGKNKEASDPAYRNIDYSALIKDTVKTVSQPVKEAPMSDSAMAADRAKYEYAVDRSAVFNENPSLEALKKVDAEHAKQGNQAPKHNLPDKFKAADKNGDGYISSQEITQTIDEFFDGTSNYTIADINALIDYFFDQ